MKTTLSALVLLAGGLLPATAAPPAVPNPPAKFELLDGDRVVFLGNTLIERDAGHGYLETLLTARWPDRNVIFRNLGWSGDTVWGHARAGFGSTADGFRKLKEHVLALNPTVLFIAYGTNEAFDGEPGLANFLKGYETLLDSLATAKPRLTVLLSPHQLEKLPAPLPDPTAQNKNVKLYCEAIGKLAAARGCRFVDLSGLPASGSGHGPLTDNGLHFTAAGYVEYAKAVAAGLGIDASNDLLMRDGLRKVINEKNELYFHRWRPQNETYLLGFRKHEQGKNAVEIVQFDPLVAEKEKEIAKLRAEGKVKQ